MTNIPTEIQQDIPIYNNGFSKLPGTINSCGDAAITAEGITTPVRSARNNDSAKNILVFPVCSLPFKPSLWHEIM